MTTKKEVLPAKICYDHLGGRLGMLLRDAFVGKDWIAKGKSDDKHYYITDKGMKGFKKLGIDLTLIKPE